MSVYLVAGPMQYVSAYTSRLHNDASLTCEGACSIQGLNEVVGPVDGLPIPELTIVIMTRAPHSAICLQHQGVDTAC